MTFDVSFELETVCCINQEINLETTLLLQSSCRLTLLACVCYSMERLDRVFLWHIASFLDPADIAHFRGTCRRLYSLLPQVTVTQDLWEGNDFHILGSRTQHWCPEKYFDGPILVGNLLKLEFSVVWKDQGWGNKKGELFAYLMRPSRTGEPVKIAEHRRLFGIADHCQTEPNTESGRESAIVAKSKKGDFCRFMRNAGGGGGHELFVNKFQVKATICEVECET